MATNERMHHSYLCMGNEDHEDRNTAPAVERGDAGHKQISGGGGEFVYTLTSGFCASRKCEQ
jgi:hypothetical protein